jgi:predicted aspartyl protease
MGEEAQLYAAMIQARANHSESGMALVSKLSADLERHLADVSRKITEAEAYLGRHPSEFYSDFYSDQLALQKQKYEKIKTEFENHVEDFRIIRAEFVVEQKRFEARRNKRKQLVLDFIKIKQIPEQWVLDDANSVFYVDGASVVDGRLTIRSHLEVLPGSTQSGPIEVHASINGQSLGRVVEQQLIVDGRPRTYDAWAFRAAKSSCDMTHIFEVGDLSIPAEGVVQLSLTRFGRPAFSRPAQIGYSALTRPAVKIGGTIVLQGRREGNHLFLPVKFKSGELVLTHECLLDTGASFTTVPKSLFQINTNESRVFETANGRVRSPVADSVVTVGDISKNVKIALFDDIGASLLGADFFEGFVYTIDLENSAIYLVAR